MSAYERVYLLFAVLALLYLIHEGIKVVRHILRKMWSRHVKRSLCIKHVVVSAFLAIIAIAPAGHIFLTILSEIQHGADKPAVEEKVAR